MKRHVLTSTLALGLIAFNTYSEQLTIKENVDFYGLFSTAFLSDAGNYSIVDNGSRVGIKFNKRDFYPNWNAGAQGEYAINSMNRPKEFGLQNNSLTTTSSSGPFSNRLGFIFFEYDKCFTASFGKQWSPFYEVTSVTDIYTIFGAEASGAFSLKSDGGYLGTGRADNSAKFSYKHENIKASFIYLATGNQEIELLDANGDKLPGNPVRIYERSYGGGLQFKGQSLTLGVAHITGNFTKDGTAENTHSSTLGIGYKIGDFDLGFVHTRSELNEIDNNGVIFDALGVEATVIYQLDNDFSFSAGLNSLKPDDKSYEDFEDNNYKIEKYIFGLTFKKDIFTGAIEAILDKSTNADGARTDENIIGISLGFLI